MKKLDILGDNGVRRNRPELNTFYIKIYAYLRVLKPHNYAAFSLESQK